MNTKDITMRILSDFHIEPTTYSGCRYIIYGISLMSENVDCINYITKSMYIDIAKEYHTSWNCVEKNIRTVVNVIWNSNNKQLLSEIFGETQCKKPTNRDFFIHLYAYIIKLYQKNLQRTNYNIEFICPKSNQRCEYFVQMMNQIKTGESTF